MRDDDGNSQAIQTSYIHDVVHTTIQLHFQWHFLYLGCISERSRQEHACWDNVPELNLRYTKTTEESCWAEEGKTRTQQLGSAKALTKSRSVSTADVAAADRKIGLWWPQNATSGTLKINFLCENTYVASLSYWAKWYLFDYDSHGPFVFRKIQKNKRSLFYIAQQKEPFVLKMKMCWECSWDLSW